jgi:hypothetical protein
MMQVKPQYHETFLIFLKGVLMKHLKTTNVYLRRLARLSFYFVAPLALILIASSDVSAKHVDITLTSSKGCTVRIVGEVGISWTGAFQSFTGTVTVSGGAGCPNGSMTFALVVPNTPSGTDLTVKFNSKNAKSVKSAVWTGNNKNAIKLLSESKINEGLCAEIRKIAASDEKQEDLKKKNPSR